MKCYNYIRVLFFTVLILISCSCVADSNSICLIRSEPNTNNNGACGSGFFVEDGILTAYHVIDDAIEHNIRVRIEYKDQICLAEIKKYDKIRDLALIDGSKILNHGTLKISDDEPEVNTEVKNFGHPKGKWKVFSSKGEFIEKIFFVKNEKKVLHYVIHANVENGMSGGPLINLSNNTVVGLLSAKSPNNTEYKAYNVGLLEIKDFLKKED